MPTETLSCLPDSPRAIFVEAQDVDVEPRAVYATSRISGCASQSGCGSGSGHERAAAVVDASGVLRADWKEIA